MDELSFVSRDMFVRNWKSFKPSSFPFRMGTVSEMRQISEKFGLDLCHDHVFLFHLLIGLRAMPLFFIGCRVLSILLFCYFSLQDLFYYTQKLQPDRSSTSPVFDQPLSSDTAGL